MFEKLEITAMAQAMSAHAGSRLGVIARNVANADTPGYRTEDVDDFATVWEASSEGAMRITRAGHIGGSGTDAALEGHVVRGHGAPNGNTVSLESEMVKAVQTRQQHDMALAIYRGTSEVLRASLGRR
jgi:flagellar basal-body rod protein FlgB